MISQTITIKKGGSYRPTPEITVINDELIKKATKKYYEENKEEYKIVNLDSLPFNELRVLNLSFQNIYKIQNLEGLVKLEELRLDNNKIKKIENIGHLVNLQWLDLSFNVIEKIEGLDKLTKLHDISLYNNQIKVMNEGLDNCVELNVISIGNNLIENIDDKVFDYFKKFRNLEVFNVAGNPFTKREQEYDLHFIFHLKNLKYIDYSFIDDAMRNKIKEKDDFKAAALARENDAKTLEDNERIERDQQEIMKKLKEAKIDTLDKIIDETNNDQDFERLKYIKGFENEVQKFFVKFKENGDVLKNTLIQKNEVKLEDVQKFQTWLAQRIQENEQETKSKIEVFQKRMKNTFRNFDAENDNGQELMDLRNDTGDLEHELLDIEMQFIEMEDEGIKMFSNDLAQSAKDMKDTSDAVFEKFKTDVGILKTNINRVTQEELDRYQEYASTENPTDEKPYTDDQEYFFENRDGVLGVVTQFIENLDGRIFKKQTETSDAFDKFTKDFTDNLNENQYERNRRNVNNIVSLIAQLREKIDDKISQANNGDDGTYSNK